LVDGTVYQETVAPLQSGASDADRRNFEKIEREESRTVADADHPRYPQVFRPLRLGPVEVPNRIYMSPHGIPLEAATPGYGAHHEPAAERVYYFRERAAGGVGTIFHSTHVAPFAGQVSGWPAAESPGLPESIPSYAKVAHAVHAEGAKIMAEIWYVNYAQKRWEVLGPEAPAFAPSPLQQPRLPSTRRQMTKAEIRAFVDAHATATRHLRQAGYDGVELHASHGALIEYFLSPYFNKREDEYGGSLDNRMRLLWETLEAVRGAAADELAVGLRINADELLPGGVDAAGTREILEQLARSGLVDFVDIDISVEPEQGHLMSTTMFEAKLHNVERVTSVRSAALPLPVLATPGRLTSIADAERLIASGVSDMVGAVRGLIADPELVRKAREGRERESRICVAINTCVDPLSVGWGCAINAAAAREERWGVRTLTAAPRRMRLVVVGAGPAGLEAARVAAARGHEVTVLERMSWIGGGVARWSRLPGREGMSSLPTYFDGQLTDLGVDVRTGVDADAQAVLELEPEVVIIATGSQYERTGTSGFVPQPVPGWERDHVVTPERLIDGDVAMAGKVVVLDEEGYHTGSGVAELAAQAGAEVEFVTRHAVAGANLGVAIPYIGRRLATVGVTVRPATYVREIGDRSVTLYHVAGGDDWIVDNVDMVVLATMRSAIDRLAEALSGSVRYVYVVGDALAPRSLREATYEGHRFARVIGEQQMPNSVTEELFAPIPEMRRAALT
jgi:2,4-dienoyl-CoA reductase-like NADH-dependent reductase (Old Yellow Enzyme family)/NADPH-dependent 2,4-dienoyl-CoA reductase/sulfur reductase-like enzyme